MKNVILVVSLCFNVVLATAGSGMAGSKSEKCPTLEQLLEEKAAREKADREDAAAQRREKLKQAIRSIDKIFPNP